MNYRTMFSLGQFKFSEIVGIPLKCLKRHLCVSKTSFHYTKGARTRKKIELPENIFLEDTARQKEKEILKPRSRQSIRLYLNDPVSAEFISIHMCENWEDGYVFELNPGPGVLSNALLQRGVPHLRVFEKNEAHLSILKDLSHSYPNLEIIEEDLLFLPTLESRPSHNYPQVLDTFFEGIKEYAWEDRVPIRIFSIISCKKSITFLRFLLAVLPNKSSLFSHGRCELFLLLSEPEYMYMKAEPKDNFSTYRWCTVLYNLFFDIQFLKQFPSEICGPWSTQQRKKNGHHLYFVKFTPKPDLFTSVVNGNKIPDFYFFIRHHLAKRTALVIPAMEGWIPSCGPRLIKEGMSVFTRFGDLSPKQLLMLFNQFSSWPEFEDSVFHAALQRFFGKGSLFDEEDDIS